MKIKDAIAWADEVKPNAFTERVKFEWLNALEGKIAADVFLLAPAEVRTLHYVYPEDLETELVPGKGGVCVRGILHMRKAVGLQIGIDFRTGRGEQGAH